MDDGLSYRFDNISQAEASAFYFKPSRRGHFMMTDADGRFFASHLPAEVSAGRYPGEFAEWRVDAETTPSGEFSYRFHAVGLNLGLRHNYSGGGLYFFDLLNLETTLQRQASSWLPVMPAARFPRLKSMPVVISPP